jgi:hypothetical protein
MAATYTEISKEEFEKFIKKMFRGYRPKETETHNEYVYDINLDENVAVRVYSSIFSHGYSAGSGQDAIRCVLFGTKTKLPLNKKAGSSIVKRTQNWRHALMDRVYSFIEEYHDKKDFYDRLAEGEKFEKAPSPTKGSTIYIVEGNSFPVKENLKKLNFQWKDSDKLQKEYGYVTPDKGKWVSTKKVDLRLPGVKLTEFQKNAGLINIDDDKIIKNIIKKQK